MCAYGFPREDKPRGGDGAPELIADGCQDWSMEAALTACHL